MTLQQLNFFANLDYETMRQSLIAGSRSIPRTPTRFVAASRA